MEGMTPDADSVKTGTFRVHLMKMGIDSVRSSTGEPMDRPMRYVMEDTMMSVIMPGVSALVGANTCEPTNDFENDLNNRKPGVVLAISVSQSVFDSFPQEITDVYGTLAKRLDFGNGVVANITVNPLADMTQEEIDNLTEDDWDTLLGEDEPVSEHDAEIIEQMKEEWESSPTPPPIIL